MDFTLIVTIIGTAVAIIGSNIGLISWLRSDMKSFENELKSDMKSFEMELKSDMKSFGNEVRGWRDDIQKEAKDFHGRLCSLEERTNKNTKTDP